MLSVMNVKYFLQSIGLERGVFVPEKTRRMDKKVLKQSKND